MSDSTWQSRATTGTWLRALAPVGAMGVVLWAAIATNEGFPCFTTGIRYGMWIDSCPTSDLRLELVAHAENVLRRREGGTLVLQPRARFLRGEGYGSWVDTSPLARGFDVRWSLLRGDEVVEGLQLGSAERSIDSHRTPVILPDIPDGDYTLVADVATPFEQRRVEVPLPLYAPAVVHIATDRPLYKPGQTVNLRSVVLARTDLTPLDERPGTWVITDPTGTAMLEERSKGGPWAISATSFPLSDDAVHGTWTATYRSGADQDVVTFDVRPFQLPRMTIDAKATEPWYGIDDEVVIAGRVTYASGAPVANASLILGLRVTEGRWPMPLEWEESFTGRAEADGSFRIRVGRVPSDLIERAVLSASLTAVSDTGEVVTGGSRVVLSVDDIAVAAVTELSDGLVQGFNNRAYVRVTTPDGRPVPDTRFELTRPYDPDSPVTAATTDADGVAAIQIDPGAPVTVVEPAPPARPRPLTPAEPSLSSAALVSSGRGLDLAERRALDGVLDRVAACGVWTASNQNVAQGIRVDGTGRVVDVSTGASPVDRCVADAVRGAKLPPGVVRTYALTWYVPDSLQPSLTWNPRTAFGTPPADLTTRLEEAGLAARRCFPRGSGRDGSAVAEVHWAVREGSLTPTLEVATFSNTGLPAAAIGCVTQALRTVRLEEPATADGMGVASANLRVPLPPGSVAPQATTRTGYELKVASAEGTPASTRLVLSAGAIPALRMRATPSVVRPGEQVKIELFRGPSFSGVLPEKLWLTQGTLEVAEAKVVDKVATFQIPTDVEGFADLQWGGARVVVFVEPAAPLSVSLSTDRPVYRPGEEARLEVKTLAGDQPTSAAVSLSGVDSTLAQLVPLLAPDDFGRVTVRVPSDRKTFDAFDARALALGQVRGENARQAALLAVGQLPQDVAGDVGTSGFGAASPPEDEELGEAFYAVLGATVARVRRWEADAPSAEMMEPATMVRLWDEALAEVAAAGGPATDPFGRPLGLDILPDALLEQVDPRVMVIDGARLPEDVISWTGYVRSGGRL